MDYIHGHTSTYLWKSPSCMIWYIADSIILRLAWSTVLVCKFFVWRHGWRLVRRQDIHSPNDVVPVGVSPQTGAIRWRLQNSVHILQICPWLPAHTKNAATTQPFVMSDWKHKKLGMGKVYEASSWAYYAMLWYASKVWYERLPSTTVLLDLQHGSPGASLQAWASLSQPLWTAQTSSFWSVSTSGQSAGHFRWRRI